MTDRLLVYVPLVVVTVAVIGWLAWVVVRSSRKKPRYPATEENLKAAPRPWEDHQ